MSAGCYNVSEGKVVNATLDFQVVAVPIPDDQLELVYTVQRMNGILNNVFSKDEREESEKYKIYYRNLLNYAKIGLEGANAHSKFAKESIDKLELELLDSESGRIKGAYLKKLGRYAALIGILTFIIAVVLSRLDVETFEEVIEFKNYFIIWSGCMVGLWVSKCIRNLSMTVEDLVAMKNNINSIIVSLMFAGFTSIIFFLIFETNLFSISFGKMASENIIKDYQILFLFGSIVGLLDNEVLIDIFDRASSMVKNNKAK